MTKTINIVLSNKQKLIIYKVKKKKVNNKRLLSGGLFLLLLSRLVLFKLTDTILDKFFLVSMNGLPVNLRVRIDIIDEKIINFVRFNQTGWSLAFSVNGNMGLV